MANQELINFIDKEIKRGVNSNDIISSLVKSGWTEADISAGFKQLGYAVSVSNGKSSQSVFFYVLVGLIIGAFIGLFSPLLGGGLGMLYSIPLNGALFSSLGFLLANWLNTKKINYFVLAIVLLTFVIQASSFLFLEPLNREILSPELDKTLEEIEKLEAEHPGTSSDDLLKELSLLKQLSNEPYIDKKYNFEINLPEGWTLNNDNKQPYSMFLSKNGDAAMIISSMDNTDNATLESVSNSIKNKPGFEFISEKKASTLKQGLSVNIIDMRSSSAQGNIRSKALIFVSENKKYIITITSNVFEPSWDEYKDLIELSELSLLVQ